MRTHTCLGMVLMWSALGAAPLAAQARTDSLEDRLERAEEAIQRLQRELASQAQAKVQSRLQNRVEISGLVLINGFYDGAKFNNADVPEWVASAQDTTGLPNSQIGGALRQTRLGVTVRPGKVLGGDLSADLQLDFFGSGGGVDAEWRLFSPPRIRTANVRLDWPHIVIHHSATPTGNADEFDKMHREKGWDELGYHFVIGNGTGSGDGQVEIGPRWVKQKHGAHCKVTGHPEYNDVGVGICLVGNFDVTRPTQAQMASLAQLVRFLMARYDIPRSNVYGHGQLKPTDCPGRNFIYSDLWRRVG